MLDLLIVDEKTKKYQFSSREKCQTQKASRQGAGREKDDGERSRKEEERSERGCNKA